MARIPHTILTKAFERDTRLKFKIIYHRFTCHNILDISLDYSLENVYLTKTLRSFFRLPLSTRHAPRNVPNLSADDIAKVFREKL